jgi:hypothetical protein
MSPQSTAVIGAPITREAIAGTGRPFALDEHRHVLPE